MVSPLSSVRVLLKCVVQGSEFSAPFPFFPPPFPFFLLPPVPVLELELELELTSSSPLLPAVRLLRLPPRLLLSRSVVLPD